LFISLSFKVRRSGDGAVATDVNKEEIEVREDGVPVDQLEIHQPRVENLTTMLVIDVSGSMRSNNKIDQARKAARAFLDKLDARADTGLILFDHLVPENDPNRFRPPSGDPARYEAHRQELRRLIDKAEPLGGTAYLDATSRALDLLRKARGRKAVLLLTDGVDMNSKEPIEAVIKKAQVYEVPVYTVGVGEPGKNERVSTVLVLDQSGSMRSKANDSDKKTKMQALHEAASRFVELMRPTAQTTLLPFSSTVGTAGAFSSDKRILQAKIKQLQPEGGTLLYDATLAGIETLVASRVTGRKAVVVLTDGKDEAPGSRHSDDFVIERAREERIPLYMLGLGRSRDIAEAVMRRMATETEGKYYHAENEESLIRIFEQLSIDLHDDGIDVESLRTLAEKTGGKYYHARDVSRLALIYEELATELQSTYTVTFRSRKQSFDGTARDISISVRRGGRQVSNVGSTAYNVHGVVVVPDMNPGTYLILFVLLGGLGVLLALPAGLGKLARSKGEAQT
jgi:VWFA-related protein